MSTTYLMLKDAEGYPDGVTLTTYTKGEVYDLPDVLATAWVNDKVCAESHKEVTEILEVIDPHTVGSYPPADVQDAHHDLERGQTEAEKLRVDRLRTESNVSTVRHTAVEEEQSQQKVIDKQPDQQQIAEKKKDDGEEGEEDHTAVKRTPSKPGPKETK